MHRVAHEHVGVQGATASFEGFAQPVRVGQVVIFTDRDRHRGCGHVGQCVAAHRLGECEDVGA
jgi:hypothetical protein